MEHILDEMRSEWTRPEPNLRGRLLKGIAIDLLVGCVLAGGIELLLIPSGYKGVPAVDVPTDKFGFREQAFDPDHLAGKMRVLAIGDSTTFGTGVLWRDAYPHQLQEALNRADSSADAIVINAGGEAACLEATRHQLERQIELVKPRAVVLLLAPPLLAMQNMASTTQTVTETPGVISALNAWLKRARTIPLKIHVWANNHFRLYQFLQYEIRFPLYRLGFMSDDLTRNTGAIYAYAFAADANAQRRYQEVDKVYRQSADYLAQIRDLLKEKHVRLYVAALPSQFEISKLSSDNFRGVDLAKAQIDPGARFETMCRELGIPFIDIKPLFVERRNDMITGRLPWDDLYIRDDYTHLDPEGQRIVADALAAEILRDEPAKK